MPPPRSGSTGRAPSNPAITPPWGLGRRNGDMAVRVLRLAAALGIVAAILLLPSVRPAAAQTPPAPGTPQMRENCPGLIASDAPRLIPAAYRLAAALNPDQVRINYVGHSTFLIERPQGVRIATDYNDYVRPSVLPGIITMNHAHDSHFTDRPNPATKYVLRGWRPSERQPARHDIQVKDVRVRNVPTNIRTWGGATELHGNLTLDLDGMVEVLHSLKAPLIIPMHIFSSFTLNAFLQRMRQDFEVEASAIPSVVISKTTLPTKPKVLVLPGR